MMQRMSTDGDACVHAVQAELQGETLSAEKLQELTRSLQAQSLFVLDEGCCEGLHAHSQNADWHVNMVLHMQCKRSCRVRCCSQ